MLLPYGAAQESMSGNLSGRNFDATELSEMTERSVNDRGVQQAREQLRKSVMGSAISAVNAARGASIFLSKRYKD
jgi:hypothetical protein